MASLAEQLAALGGLGDQETMFMRQLAQAQALSGQPMHSSPLGQAFGGMGALARNLGGMMAGVSANNALQGIQAQRQSARDAFMKAMAPPEQPAGTERDWEEYGSKAPHTDMNPMWLGDPQADPALAADERRLGALGMQGVASGDPVLAQVGQHLMSQAEKGPGERLRALMGQQELSTAQANAAATARERERQAGPVSEFGRTLAQREVPGIQIPADMTQGEFERQSPTMARIGASERAAAARAKGKGGGAGGPVNSDVKDTADGIESGLLPPEVKGTSKQNLALRAELARRGFNLAKAASEWSATQRHIATMNAPQQERLRQVVDFTQHSLDAIEEAYAEWQRVGPASGFRMLNRAALNGAKQLGGEVGAAAQSLETQITDFTSEMGTIYSGSNAPTDHGLKLAAENLSASWDKPTFAVAVKNLRRAIGFRRSAMDNSTVAGVGGSRYLSPAAPAAPPGGGGGRVRVTNGKETLEIDAADLAEAERDGFRRM